MSHSHHHPHGHGPSAQSAVAAHRLMRLASYASVAVACVLMSAKLVAWWKTDSLAMLSSLTDSVFDVAMSVINMLALRYALKPADEDHQFGHTAIEDIAGLAQCACIAASMGMIALQAIERVFNPQPLDHAMLGVEVSVLALVLTGALVLFQTYVARRSGSLIVAADRLHYVGDILFNVGVVVALGASTYGFTLADPLMAMVIAASVLWSTKPIAIRAFNNLMDREMEIADKIRILELVAGVPEIRGHHHLKTRYSGAKPFIQLHIELDAALNFRDAHTITERLEQVILDAFPTADVIVHPDPV